jgi:colanic acid biosynthesis glycosyl transferase WcaI
MRGPRRSQQSDGRGRLRKHGRPSLNALPAVAEVKQGERWLILSQYYAPEVGAPQLRLRALASELRRHGIQIEVLTGFPNYPAGVTLPGYRGRWQMRETIDGIPVRRTWLFPATGRSAATRLANYFSFTATALAAALLGRKPDRLFVESQPMTLGVVAVAMKWLRGVPYVYNVPDLQVDVARELGFMRSRTLLSVMTRLENLFLKASWNVSTVSEGFVEHLASRGVPRSRVSFLPNGADTDLLRPTPPDEELLDRWSLHGKKTFVYIGTLAYYHGVATLIGAAALLQQREDIAFLLIGDGPERKAIEELAREQALRNVVLGPLRSEELARCYSIAYASLATLKDLHVARKMRPAKIFPALSCGVPIVFSGSGETPTLLEQHGAGISVPAEDPAALARAIEELADDVPGRNAMGTAGRELAESQFDWRTIVERWLKEIGYDSPVDDPASS